VNRWRFNEDVAVEIASRFRGWTSCTPRGDIAELATYLHDDFLYVSVFGKRCTEQ
jgi:hypothetical protein